MRDSKLHQLQEVTLRILLYVGNAKYFVIMQFYIFLLI